LGPRLLCDGHGNILKGAFPVENNPAGVAWLIEQITATARHRKIPKNQIFLGGEDEPAYVANFTAALREAGYAQCQPYLLRRRLRRKAPDPTKHPSASKLPGSGTAVSAPMLLRLMNLLPTKSSAKLKPPLVAP